jgi:5-methyltetrahydropteroyltriglutamate--homocysteine methyltransferase
LVRHVESDSRALGNRPRVAITNVETGEQVAERIRAHRWLTPEQTIITSSCGFNHLPRHIALGKLRAMTEAKAILSASANS